MTRTFQEFTPGESLLKSRGAGKTGARWIGLGQFPLGKMHLLRLHVASSKQGENQDMAWFRRPVAAAFFLAPAVCLAGVDLELSGVPAQADPGGEVAVTLDYTRDGTEEEQRLVFFLQAHRASDGKLLHKEISDNNGNGYPADSGQFDLVYTTPDEPGTDIYFEGWAVPWSVNRALMERLESYPTDGTFTYLWGGGGYGVTQDVYYLGSLICPKPSGDTTYCSGLAFETFVLGWEDYNTEYGHPDIWGMSASDMQDFRLVWYGVTDAEKLAARAIPEYGLGIEITDWEELQPGDSIQFWRNSGSGHNPIFIDWVRNASGEITGVYYWGSQSSTNGIGYRSESFNGFYGIDPDRFYAGRARKPRDQADYDWALASTSTENAPTSIRQAAPDGWVIH